MAQSFPILFILLLCLSTPDFTSQAEQDFVFRGFKDSASAIDLTGAAEIERNGLLKLTNDTSRLIGHAFYQHPIRFKNSPDGKAFSFSSAFVFSIVPEYKDKGGHGMAFTISKSKDLSKPLAREYLGLMNSDDIGNFSNHVFAVEFDTVLDFSFHDMSDNHVGIDINSLVSNASVNASCFTHGSDTKEELDLKSGKRIQAWVDYDSSEKMINVTLSLSSVKPSSPILSFPVDLSPVFLEYMYVGFSAATGLLSSSHYVFGWSFATNGLAESLDLSQLPSVPGLKRNQVPVVLASLLSVAALFVLAVLIGVYVVKKRDVIESWELDVGPHRFEYKELKKATRGFRDGEILGSGGFGKVYKGTLPSSKTLVAVKQINHESKHGLRAFISEIASIGRLRHRNLVQLLGWCRRRGDLLLVYEFMPYGSLDKYIFDESEAALTWEQRLKIVKGVASGLLYLHEEWEQTVIHRDIKAANVLLDSELNGRLGDFGLAKMYDHESNAGTTKVVGTLGYLAPELTKTGKPTTSSDVFAFGALLLEVACGRRPVETKALPEELILVDWVWDMWKRGAILEVMDPRLKGEYDEMEALQVLKLGLMCSSNAPNERPSMRQVVRYLEGETAMPSVLIAPDEYDVKNVDHVRVMDPRAEDFVDSYPSSSVFDGDQCDVDLEAGSRSPLSS